MNGCLDRLSEYHFKEAHDFYWQRSSQHHGSTACDIVSLKILLTFLFKSCITGTCPATLPAQEVIMPRYPPPILKLFLTGSARISGLTQKADTKTEIRLKTENYHP